MRDFIASEPGARFVRHGPTPMRGRASEVNSGGARHPAPGASAAALRRARRAVPASRGCLTCMHRSCILVRMRTTINIRESLLEHAARLSGIREKTALVHAGLEALIARESAKRLAALGGTERRLRRIRRRRFRRAATTP